MLATHVRLYVEMTSPTKKEKFLYRACEGTFGSGSQFDQPIGLISAPLSCLVFVPPQEGRSNTGSFT